MNSVRVNLQLYIFTQLYTLWCIWILDLIDWNVVLSSRDKFMPTVQSNTAYAAACDTL